MEILRITFLVFVFFYNNVYINTSPCGEYQNIIEVTGGNEGGTNISDCYQSNKTLTICPNLTIAFKYVENNTCILLSQLEHELKTSQSKFNLQNFTLTSTSKVNISCTDDVGIYFERSQNIIISNITFHACGMNITFEEEIKTRVALTFHGTFNLQLHGISFFDHDGYAVAIIDASGNVNLNLINITNTNNKSSSGLVFWNSGMASGGSNNVILIENSMFQNLFAPELTKHNLQSDNANVPFGKGAAISFFSFGNSVDNVVRIINCQYIGNYAKFGGAVYIYYAANTKMNLITFHETIFARNSAKKSGAGIFFIDQSTFISNNSVMITNCSFQDNSALHGGGSALYVLNALAVFRGNTHLIDNNGSAIVAGSSKLDVHGGLHLDGNKGENGAGIYMYESSTVTLHSTTNLTFTNNSATDQGGALYVFHRFHKAASICFFSYGDETSRVSFSGTVSFVDNAALRTGDDIYASTYSICDEGKQIKTWPNFFLSNNSKSLGSAVSGTSINSSKWQNHHLDEDLTPKIKLVDEFGRAVTARVSLRTNTTCRAKVFPPSISCSSCSFDSSTSNVVVSDKNSEVSLRFYGNANTCNFTLSTLSELGVTDKVIKDLRVTGCPPFFDHIDGACKCNASGTKAVCIDQMLYVPPNTWVMDFANGVKEVQTCPDSYCNVCDDLKDKMYIQLCRYVQGKQCSNNRSEHSRLCSKCITNFSVGLGSKSCLDCRGHKAIGLIFEEIGIVVVLQIVIILLNYNYYASYLIPFIYFYQMVPFFLYLNGTILTSEFNSFVKLLLSFTNSEGFDVNGRCLFDGLDDLSKLWWQFGSALIWIIMYVIFSMVAKRIRRLGNAWIRAGPIVFIASFLDIFTFCLKSINWVHIDGNPYVFVFADEKYLSKRHQPLFIAALVFILLCLALICFVVCKLCKRQFYRRVFNTFDLHYDVRYDARSKPNSNHWIYPLYLIFLMVFISVGIGRAHDDRSVILMSIVVIFMCVYGLMMPYLDNKCNISELIILSDLLIIGTLTNSLTTQDKTTPKFIEVFLVIPVIILFFWLLFMIDHTFSFNFLNRLTRRKSKILILKVLATYTYFALQSYLKKLEAF